MSRQVQYLLQERNRWLVPLRAAVGHAPLFRFQFLLANATGIEVGSYPSRKSTSFQCFKDNSPNRRSHEVQRKLAFGERFWASRHRGQCSAHPA